MLLVTGTRLAFCCQTLTSNEALETSALADQIDRRARTEAALNDLSQPFATVPEVETSRLSPIRARHFLYTSFFIIINFISFIDPEYSDTSHLPT